MAPTLAFAEHLEPYDSILPKNFPKEHYQGKRVIVTGGGQGLGVNITEAFAQAGVESVLIGGRTESKLRDTAARLSETYSNVKFTTAKLDIASKESIEAFVKTLPDAADILINNAGVLGPLANILDVDLDEWWNTFQVNALGTVRMTRELIKHHQANKSSSQAPLTVISINTAAALNFPLQNFSSYGGSKAALLRALELTAVDIPVSVAKLISVHPGMVKTDMAAAAQLEGMMPFTDAQVAAGFVVWLASEEADFLAGRFAWVNWDLEELKKAKQTILEEDLLKTALKM